MYLLQGLLVLVVTMLAVTATKKETHFSSTVVRCPFPTQQIYSYEARKCVSLVNGPCSINKSDKLTGCSKLIECVPGAVCTRAGLFSYCICKPGLVDTADRKCALVYGQSCDISSEVKCDEHTLLGCIKGKCDCVNPTHEFNAYNGLCVGKVGAFCKNLSPKQVRNYVPNHDYVICGYGAACFTRAGFVERYSFVSKNEFVTKRFRNGVCLCDGISGYKETENRTCEYTRQIYKPYREERSEHVISFAEMSLLGWILLVAVILIIMSIIFFVVNML